MRKFRNILYPSLLSIFRLDVTDLNTFLEGAITIRRDEFETMSTPLMNKIEEVLRDTFTKSDITSRDIHKVLLVGGSSRMPMIQMLLRKMFATAEHLSDTNPDEVVAMGAAYYASYLNY